MTLLQKVRVHYEKPVKKTNVSTHPIIQNNLPTKYKDHKLIGSYEGSRELHIEPDWLLIYRISAQSIILERTGTHCDLFK